MKYLNLARTCAAFSLLATSAAAVAAVGELEYDPFQKFATIPKEELVVSATPQIAPDGSFLENGKPRYYPATCWYGGFEFMPEHNPGASDALKWLYERMPDYETVSRLGFDATGLSCTFKWLRMYRPNQREFPCDWKKSLPSFKCGIPLYMDFTASEWGLGSMNLGDRPLDPDFKGERGKWPDEEPKPRTEAKLDIDDDDAIMSLDDFDPGKQKAVAKNKAKAPAGPPKGYLGPEAFTVGHNHWVAYSTVHPKGRKIWLNMWKYGAKEVLDLGLKPWCYELFNEPAVYDESEYAHAEFDRLMRRKFGDDYQQTQAGIVRSIEYAKYLEERFASLMDEGVEALRSVDPDARATFQPCTIRTRGIDLYRSYRNLGVVCSHTGGRGLMEAHMLRGLADGKPIVDNEMYFGNTTNSIRQSYLDQYQRGFNMSMSFKWSCDRSSYNFMNRVNVRPDALLGVRIAKRDIMDVNEFFTPRERGIRREVAVLFSNPTERYAQQANHSGYRYFDQAVVGIDAAHLPVDVIWEEDLTNSVQRLGRYRVLVTAGTDMAYPGTLKNIRNWVEHGGTLVAFERVMALDEYGRANPEAFPIEPGEQKLGKGKVIFYPGKMSAQTMGEKVAAAALMAGIKPEAQVLDAAEDDLTPVYPVEVVSAARNGMRAWIVTARTMTDRAVRFKPEGFDSSMTMIRIWNEVENRGGETVIVSHRREILPGKDGSFGLYLVRGNSVLLVGGRKSALKARYPQSEHAVWESEPERTEEIIKQGLLRIESEREAKASATTKFRVDSDAAVCIDLAGKANALMKQLAGVDSASKGPISWDTEEFAGVPVKILRYDQNGFKDCIAAGSKATAIELPDFVHRLYMLHNGSLKVEFEYADGEKIEMDTGRGRKKPGIWCWSNPRLRSRLKAMRLASRDGKPAAVIAITAEKPSKRAYVVPGEDLIGGGCSSGVRAIATNGVCRIELEDTATSWSTAGIAFKNPVPCDKGMYNRITVEVNRLPDQWGNYHDHATPQFRLFGKNKSGQVRLGANWMVGKYESGPWFYRTDNDPDSWQTMTFFVSDGFLPEDYREATTLRIQFQQMPAQHSGLEFRNITFWRDANYRPSDDDEEKAPAARTERVRRSSPKFESPNAEIENDFTL